MKAHWRPLGLSNYSATSKAPSALEGGMTDIRGLPNAHKFIDSGKAGAHAFDKNSFGGILLSGRPTYTARQNLDNILNYRTMPNAQMLSEAKLALARMEARQGEDMVEWAENLAQSSIDVEKAK